MAIVDVEYSKEEGDEPKDGGSAMKIAVDETLASAVDENVRETSWGLKWETFVEQLEYSTTGGEDQTTDTDKEVDRG